MISKLRKEQIEKWKQRDVSWSQLSSWMWSKDQWAFKYLFGRYEEANQAMLFGNTVGDTLGTPTSMVPLLNPHLVGIKEYELRVKMGSHNLVGFCDHYCPDTKVLNENKTSQTLDKWTQSSVDKHDQLTAYCLMLLLKEKTKPEDVEIWLNFIPVYVGGDFHPRIDPDEFYRFPTKRTTAQCLLFGAWIDKTLKEMEKYAMTVDDIA